MYKKGFLQTKSRTRLLPETRSRTKPAHGCYCKWSTGPERDINHVIAHLVCRRFPTGWQRDRVGSDAQGSSGVNFFPAGSARHSSSMTSTCAAADWRSGGLSHVTFIHRAHTGTETGATSAQHICSSGLWAERPGVHGPMSHGRCVPVPWASIQTPYAAIRMHICTQADTHSTFSLTHSKGLIYKFYIYVYLWENPV